MIIKSGYLNYWGLILRSFINLRRTTQWLMLCLRFLKVWRFLLRAWLGASILLCCWDNNNLILPYLTAKVSGWEEFLVGYSLPGDLLYFRGRLVLPDGL